MYRNIFLKTLRDLRRSLFWWGIGMFLFSLYIIAVYPTIGKDTTAMQDYIDRMPESFRAMMGGEIDLSTVEGYLSMEAFSFFYPFMMLAFAVTFGSGFIGGEEESGTLDLLLATPVPRWRVVLEKFLALVTFALIVFAITYVGFLLGGKLSGIEHIPAGRLLKGMFNMLPMTLLFAALPLALTGIKGGRGLALGVSLGFAAVSYLTYSMAEVAHIPLWLQKLSPWYYYNGAHVMREGLNGGYIALLLAVVVVLVGAAMWGFERRDVGV